MRSDQRLLVFTSLLSISTQLNRSYLISEHVTNKSTTPKWIILYFPSIRILVVKYSNHVSFDWNKSNLWLDEPWFQRVKRSPTNPRPMRLDLACCRNHSNLKLLWWARTTQLEKTSCKNKLKISCKNTNLPRSGQWSRYWAPTDHKDSFCIILPASSRIKCSLILVPTLQ